jgi:7,8-dihydroneopterin aldolase/epimerase/oxygenase
VSRSDRLRISGIEFHGHCGCTEAEREIGQRLSVDLELVLPLAPATETDDLNRTVDYVKLTQRIVQVGRQLRPVLVETLAERLAQTVFEDSSVEQVTVRLRKVSPPVEEIKGAFEVVVTRDRT